MDYDVIINGYKPVGIYKDGELIIPNNPPTGGTSQQDD